MKVLIVRFSSIGDIVLTTPVIRALREQVPGVEIHYLTKAKYREVLAYHPSIDRLWTIEKDVGEVGAALQSEAFDHVVDLHANFRSSRVRSLLGAPSTTFRKLSFQKWLLATFHWNLLPDVHVVDRYLETLGELGVHGDDQGLEYYLGPGDKVALQDLPEAFRDGFVAIVIGGQHPGKLYPTDRTAEVCRLLGQPVVLLGGPEDQARGAQIATAAAASVFNACGRYSFNQSVSLLDQASCVMTNDTGLMHVAAALKKRVISIWGATVPEFGMAPYRPGAGSRILEPSGDCRRPYSKLGNKVFYKPAYDCWDGLEPEVVADAVLDSVA